MDTSRAERLHKRPLRFGLRPDHPASGKRGYSQHASKRLAALEARFEALHVCAMAIQGGAQFRSANVPVGGTNVPSRLNNFAFDARYTLGLGGIDNALLVAF